MKLFIVLTIACLRFSIAFSQTEKGYYLLQKADSLYDKHSYKEAASLYAMTFSTGLWHTDVDKYYKLAQVYCMAGYKDSAFQSLRHLGLLHFNDSRQLNGDSVFFPLKKDKRWNSIIDRVKKNENEISDTLKYLLDTVFDDDQRFRVVMKPTDDSIRTDSLWRMQDSLDCINLNIIQKIFDKYGWPDKRLVGNKGNNTLWIVIDHADLSVMEKYLRIMQEASERGAMKKQNMALVEDRITALKNGYQIYGTQYFWNEKKNAYELFPINNIKEVDKRRIEVGLPPLREYIKENNILIIPFDYK
jgi:hypothetical protein